MKTAVLLGLLGAYPRIAGDNLVSFPNDFGNAYWGKIALNTTGTPAFTDVAQAPDFTMTADKVIPTAVSGDHVYFKGSIIPAGVNSASVFGRAAEYKHLLIGNGSDGHYAIFNLEAGTFTTTGATISGAAMRWYRNGWWRVWCTVTVATAKAFSVGVANTSGAAAAWSGDGSSGLFVWGTQLRTGVTTP